MSNNFSGNVFGKTHDESRQGEAFASTLMHLPARGRKMYLESYGCAMNFSDSEIIASVLQEMGFTATPNVGEADLIFINTCSIRENAEDRVRGRLRLFNSFKKKNPSLIVGVLGCMAERLKGKLLEEEKLVDLVVGPDAYKDLPNLIERVDGGQRAVNVLLSREETYAEISPVRLGGNGVMAFVTIMRGCDNMCSFCVVPFTRGRERSRDMYSILDEVRDLQSRGYKDITLLGQNVDSYKWSAEQWDENINFAQLLAKVAQEVPGVRIRFSTSHPKDITDEVLYTMAKYPNICRWIHLPVQSGSSETLLRMNRTYDRPWYLNRIAAIRHILPDCAITTDIITGFCNETEEEHQETLSIMEAVKYDYAYMFKYSERPGTMAAKRYDDNVPEDVKSRRLDEIINAQNRHSVYRNQIDVGQVFDVLVEGRSKKSDADWCGRSSQNKMILFPKTEGVQKGDFIKVRVDRCTQATLFGTII